mgnify:CR=1 FL=1
MTGKHLLLTLRNLRKNLLYALFVVAGLAVGIADRLDSLAGLFAAGLAPTGNKDPFALRRAARRSP